MNHKKLLHLSLLIVWFGTALVSFLEFNGQSRLILIEAGLVNETLIFILIAGGILFDILIGLMLLIYPNRRTYLAALFAMGLLTLIGTFLQMSLWLHPLGPLLKNIPIAAILLFLSQENKNM